MKLRRLIVALAALVPIAGGCNAILGIDSHPLGGSGGTMGTGGVAGAFVCSGGDVTDAGADPDAGTRCGFTMPNPATAGLPHPADYTPMLGIGAVKDNVTGLIWEATVPFTVYMLGQASRPCDEKGGGWRLPTRVELTSLVDFTVAKPGPTINGEFADDPIWGQTTGTNGDRKFWTSSHGACSTGIGWYVDFANGSTHQESIPGATYKVRCVQGPPSSCPATRYQDNGDGTVTDSATGLTWQRSVASPQVWSEAAAFCPNTLGAGWRLPSLTETQTIIDETKEEPAIDRDAFPDTPPKGYFWTSSPQAGDATRAYYVTVVHGHSDTEPVTTQYWVRCVR